MWGEEEGSAAADAAPSAAAAAGSRRRGEGGIEGGATAASASPAAGEVVPEAGSRGVCRRCAEGRWGEEGSADAYAAPASRRHRPGCCRAVEFSETPGIEKIK